MTVVRDDADGLVAWLPTGTPVLRVGRADGRGKRDDPSTLFTAESVQDTGVWAEYDVLRVAPTGRPWTVWVLFAEHTKEFAGWYVNLEDPHVRDAHTVYTRDHVLDLMIEPDRTATRKDEDELELAVAQGLYDAATAAAFEAELAAAESVVAKLGLAVLRRLGELPAGPGLADPWTARSRRPSDPHGAACRNRTDDLFITSESLCRLS